MRLTLLTLIGMLCIACCYSQYAEEKKVGLEDVADQGEAHASEGDRLARHWGGGWGGGWRGGWGGGGWGGGGWGGGGWGGGGWGGRRWGGGWGGGYGGWGRGGWGWGR